MLEKYKQFKKKFNYFLLNQNRIVLYWKKYPTLITLGYNCEIANELSKLLPYGMEHYTYTYAYQFDKNSFLESLKNINDIPNDTYSLYECEWGIFFKGQKYQIGFHPRNDISNYSIYDQKTKKEIIDSAYKEFHSRITHLCNKLDSTITTTNTNCLFLIKIRKTKLKDDINYLNSVYKILKNKSQKYKLLCILEKISFNKKEIKYLKKNLLKGIRIDFVKEFAKDSEVGKTGDLKGWKKVLKKIFYIHIDIKLNNFHSK